LSARLWTASWLDELRLTPRQKRWLRLCRYCLFERVNLFFLTIKRQQRGLSQASRLRTAHRGSGRPAALSCQTGFGKDKKISGRCPKPISIQQSIILLFHRTFFYFVTLGKSQCLCGFSQCYKNISYFVTLAIISLQDNLSLLQTAAKYIFTASKGRIIEYCCVLYC